MGYSKESIVGPPLPEFGSKFKDKVLLVPDLYGPNNFSIYPDFVNHFDHQLYISNKLLLLDIFTALETHNKDLSDSLISGIYPINQEGINISELIKAFKQSNSYKTEVLNIFEDKGMDNSWAEKLEQIQSWVTTTLVKPGPKIFISPDHSSDSAIISAIANNHVSLNQVAMIFIDRHADFGHRYQSNLLCGVTKANFQTHIMENGIGGIHIIGIPNKTATIIKSGKIILDSKLVDLKSVREKLNDMKRTEMSSQELELVWYHDMHKAYIQYHDQNLLSMASSLNLENGNINIHSLERDLNDTIQSYREKGIENIFISVDLDSLDMNSENITATEYNPHSILLSAGVVDLKEIIKSFNYSSSELLIQRLKRKKINDKDVKCVKRLISNLHVLREAVSSPELVNKIIHHEDKGGFTIQQLLSAIEIIKEISKKYGINIGIKINKANVLGSVNEGVGADYEGKTAKATFQIAEKMIE